MNIISYKNNANLKDEYLELVSCKYGAHKNFDYFFNDLKEAIRFSQTRQQPDFVVVTDNEKILAHIAVILDPQLPKGTAFWGFFEAPNDKEIVSALWEKLKEVAHEKEINKILGPVNGSVWHQYRFIKETDDPSFFKSELFCEPFYYELLKNMNSTEISYYSAYRNDFRNLISITWPFYKKAINNGFSIIESAHIAERNLGDILQLCKKVFQNSWGYINLSETDFASLYSSQKLISHLNKVYFLQKNQDIVGYCGILQEDNVTLILKTIAILPEFQNLGLANALIYKVHTDAQKNQIKKVVYALIREDNTVKRLPKDDAVIFRRYASFESNI